MFPNIDCKKIKNYEKRIYSEYDKSNLSTSEKKNKKYRNKKLIKERYNYCYSKNFKTVNKKVLEIGFGQADFLMHLKKKKISCHGIEYNQKSCRISKKAKI